MIKMRKEMEAGEEARERLGLTDEELAFYDALVLTGGQLYDEPFMASLVRDIVAKVRANLKPDWTRAHREDVQASIRTAVRRVLLQREVQTDDFDLIIAKVMENAAAIYHDWPLMPISKED
jgi:type I restriction enzyme R subunit